jgi:hypothetical protein
MSRFTHSAVCAVLVLALLAVGLGACGSEPTPNLVPTSSPVPATNTTLPPTATPQPTSTPTPVPTPTPALPSAESLLETAMQSLWEVDSYHVAADLLLVGEAEGMTMEMPMTFVGDHVPSDGMQGTVSVEFLGERLEVSVIVIGETVYVTDPETGEWLISPETSSLLLPTEGLDQLAPEDIEELEIAGEESLDGVPVYHLRGLVSAETLQLGELDMEEEVEGEFHIDYWIGVQDGLVRKSTLEGEFEVSGEEPTTVGLTMTAIYSGYGELVDIQAPEIATASPASEAAIAGSLDCAAAGEGFVAYGDDELGVAFCYPSGWVVDDLVEFGGSLALSPEGFRLDGDMPECLIMVYPHKTLAQFPTPMAGAGDILGLGFNFFVMIVTDASSDGWPEATASEDQETAFMTAHGTLEGEDVLGIITGVMKDKAVAMTVSYILDEEAYRAPAEAIVDSIVVALPKYLQAGEVQPIALNAFEEGSWTADQPDLHSFHVEGSTPALFVSQLLAQGGSDDKADLQILGPEGVFVDQFTTGWMGAQTYTSDDDGGLVQYNVFGYLQPDALRVVLEQDGEHTISVGGWLMWHKEGKYRLGIFDMRPDSPAVLDIVEGELGAGEAYEYEVDGTANRAMIAYLRPTGPLAEDLTLSLELLDEGGESLEERHNYSYSGEDVFLYWLPRDDVPYSVRVTEVDGQPAEFEFTMLQEPGAEEPEAAALTCDEYSVDVAVQANGDLLVEERQTLTFSKGASQESQRTFLLDDSEGIEDMEVWEGEQQYVQSESGEAGTYMVVEEEEGLVVKWFHAVQPDLSSTFTLRYAVRDAVRQDGEGRDVVAWQAIQPDRDHRIRRGQVVVHLPAEVEVHEIIAFGAQGTGKAKCDSFEAVITDEVTFELSHDLSPGQGMEIRVVYDPARSGA